LPFFNLIGTKINPLSYEQILTQMSEWIGANSNGHMVVCANTHVLVESRSNGALRQAVDSASLVVPDGMPLVVAARWRGFPLKTRAYGPELMHKALSTETFNHWKHYLYGGTTETLTNLHDRYLNTHFCGNYAPPFRSLTKDEDMAAVEAINQSDADVLWIGLGCPKQEIWIHDHLELLKVPVILGVGQAFDVLSGIKTPAPVWMQNSGLEWLFRLTQEPQRLWKRYLTNNTQFLYFFLRQQFEINFGRHKTH
jgi:N-acetylglucosaminyldiphosphoundecaprenol N-acetyl-beta-D-mannosaminyltransferase